MDKEADGETSRGPGSGRDEAGRAAGARLSGGPRNHTTSGPFSMDKQLQMKGKAVSLERDDK